MKFSTNLSLIFTLLALTNCGHDESNSKGNQTQNSGGEKPSQPTPTQNPGSQPGWIYAENPTQHWKLQNSKLLRYAAIPVLSIDLEEFVGSDICILRVTLLREESASSRNFADQFKQLYPDFDVASASYGEMRDLLFSVKGTAVNWSLRNNYVSSEFYTQSMDTVEMTDCETLKLNAQKSSKLEGFWKAVLRGTDYKIHHSIEMPVNYEINYTFKRTKT